MGVCSSQLGKKSTAKDVIEYYSENPVQARQLLTGKVAVVTGGNSGIGLETVKALSYAGCRVIMGSRTVDAGLKAIEDEIKVPGEGNYVVENPDIKVVQLDLMSLDSIRVFSSTVMKESRIDFVICNAGIMALPTLELTEYGWEKQMATNHFGHFYLVQLLKTELVNQGLKPRIVVLSSMAHRMDTIYPEDMHFTKREYDPWKAYGQSKTANILFAKSLSDLLGEKGITAVSVHPGVIATNLARHMKISDALMCFFKHCYLDKTIPQGAATTIYGCLEPTLETKELNGSYLTDCAVAPVLTPYAEDKDGHLRDVLWKVTHQQIKAHIKPTLVSEILPTSFKRRTSFAEYFGF